MSVLAPKNREELDDILRPFDKIGSYMDAVSPAGTEMTLILDHLYVVRAFPDIDSDGNPQNMSWWLGWFPVGWTDGGLIARPHVTKIVKMEREDYYWLRLHGSDRERMDIYWFNPPEDDPLIAIYDQWKEGAKSREAAMAQNKRELAGQADTWWPDPIDLSPIDLTESQKKRWQF